MPQKLYKIELSEEAEEDFDQVEDSTVKVIAIFHSSRNPKIWNERIKK